VFLNKEQLATGASITGDLFIVLGGWLAGSKRGGQIRGGGTVVYGSVIILRWWLGGGGV